MYLWMDHEISRQYREEIRREIRVARMGSRRRKFRLARALEWELARYGANLATKCATHGGT
jgi:hypothetical protein